MDGRKFDTIVKTMAAGASRRHVLRGAAGAVVALVGLGRAAAQEVKQCPSGARQTRHLGEACGETQCCVAAENLECQKVAETGAFRCECKTGFVRCGGRCVALACPGGQQLNTTTCACQCPPTTCSGGQVLNTSTCLCECPSTAPELCQGVCRARCTSPFVRDPATCGCVCPSGTVACGGTCVSNQCPTGQSFNPTTCTCSCPSNQVFCGGACHDPATECAGLHNKIFNIECCNQGANPCQNPGQPSGRCKA